VESLVTGYWDVSAQQIENENLLTFKRFSCLDKNDDRMKKLNMRQAL
jgi:hypothetical protein